MYNILLLNTSHRSQDDILAASLTMINWFRGAITLPFPSFICWSYEQLISLLLTLSPTGRGGGPSEAPLEEMMTAAKHMSALIWIFLTFPEYKKENFSHCLRGLIASYLIPPWKNKKKWVNSVGRPSSPMMWSKRKNILKKVWRLLSLIADILYWDLYMGKTWSRKWHDNICATFYYLTPPADRRMIL